MEKMFCHREKVFKKKIFKILKIFKNELLKIFELLKISIHFRNFDFLCELFENIGKYCFLKKLFLDEKIKIFIRIFFYHLVCVYRMLDTHLEQRASLATTRNQLLVWSKNVKNQKKTRFITYLYDTMSPTSF